MASYTSHSAEILELALKWAAAPQLPSESQDSPKLHVGSAARSLPLITGGVPKQNVMCFLWEKGLTAFRVVVSMGIETRRQRTVHEMPFKKSGYAVRRNYRFLVQYLYICQCAQKEWCLYWTRKDWRAFE